MHQAPTPIWNEIAATQTLKTDWARTMFPKTPEALDEALEAEADELEAAGHSDKAIVAYQEAKPLLLENEAISRYVAENERPELRGSLPEVLNPAEAVQLMAAEHNLGANEKAELQAMLEKAPTSSS